jgi:hypothetical protein
MSSITTTLTPLGKIMLATGPVLIVLGLLAVSLSIIARRLNARGYIDALVPYQGGLGFIICLWGMWILFIAMMHLNMLTGGPWMDAPWPWLWFAMVLSDALVIALGLLLGYPLLTRYRRSRNLEVCGERVQLSPVPYQAPLGCLATVLGMGIAFLTLPPAAPVVTVGPIATWENAPVRQMRPCSIRRPCSNRLADSDTKAKMIYLFCDGTATGDAYHWTVNDHLVTVNLSEETVGGFNTDAKITTPLDGQDIRLGKTTKTRNSTGRKGEPFSETESIHGSLNRFSGKLWVQTETTGRRTPSVLNYELICKRAHPLFAYARGTVTFLSCDGEKIIGPQTGNKTDWVKEKASNHIVTLNLSKVTVSGFNIDARIDTTFMGFSIRATTQTLSDTTDSGEHLPVKESIRGSIDRFSGKLWAYTETTRPGQQLLVNYQLVCKPAQPLF